MLAQLEINDLVCQQRAFFQTGKTKDVNFRIAQLQALKQAIAENEADIFAALYADLHKSAFEAFATEVRVIKDINYILKNIKSWAKPKRVPTTLEQFPAAAYLYPEPRGVALIIGAWNYPVYLMLAPAIAAIAAGCCAILKPSELAPHTSRLLAQLIKKYFDPAYLTVVEGGADVCQQLLKSKFDSIFFTGSAAVGKIVMAAAAEHLTPVTLELGGKSPCLVDADVDVKLAAKRIAWGKFLNAGQTCVAPDYVLVDKAIAADFLAAIKTSIQEFYGADPAASPDYPRIINEKHFHRLVSLLGSGDIIIGGETNAGDRYIAPTVIANVSPDAPMMQSEIFGPILPVIVYENLASAIDFVNQRPQPLALYIFSRDRQHQQQILQSTSSGSACINDAIVQISVADLPFGGVGNSGMGSYNGKAGFDTFSHYKSVLSRPFFLDLPLKYAPYGNKLPWLRQIIK